MPDVVYPSTLPGPSLITVTPAERRLLSDVTGGPQQARGVQRDYLATQRAEWGVLTPAQAAIFDDWWKTTLSAGGAWFAATWVAPQGYTALVRRFLGAPQWTHLSGGHWRVSADLLVRGRGMLPQTVAPYTSDIDISAVSNAGATSAVGITAAGLDAGGTYQVSFPTGRTYTAHSTWSIDSDPLAGGLPWLNYYQTTTAGGVTTNRGATGVQYATAAAAYAATTTANLTGSTSYTFWIVDGIPSDNRGGLSITLTRIA